MNEERRVEVNDVCDRDIDVFRIYDYFDEHPIMFLGVGVSITILAVCKLLDDKYNKEGK